MQRVAVLICTYQGEKHIRQQIESIVRQTHRDWCIFVSDDGSSDDTLAILAEYYDRLGPGRLRIFAGPRRGFAANFFSLLARDEVEADFYTFTDQDDEWDDSKIERAIWALAQVPAGKAALYGSRSELVDEEGRHLGFSRMFTRPSSFANALVQNMVSGNTMVLNAEAMRLIRRVGTDVQVSAHDWWAYLLVTGCGGVMIYDRYPTIRYRQHGRNLYGGNISLAARWHRVKRLLAGDFRDWNAKNLAALGSCRHLLTEDSRRRVALFEQARQGWAAKRLFYLARSRVYRQTWDGQLGLVVAAMTKRI